MKKMTFLFGMVFLFFSCNSGSKESSDAKSDSNTEEVSNKDSGETYNCLKKFEDDFGALLTKEEITSVYPIDFEAAKEELRSGSYGEHTYHWPSDRPSFVIEVSGIERELPDQNIMGIKNLSFYSDDSRLNSTIETFDMGYKELSEKELEKIQSNLDKQKEEVKNTGEDLMKVHAKRSWEFVDGLGSSAWYKWGDNYGGELAVLAGKASFEIIMKVSNDPDENRQLAKQVAEQVLAKCK